MQMATMPHPAESEGNFLMSVPHANILVCPHNASGSPTHLQDLANTLENKILHALEVACSTFLICPQASSRKHH